MGWRDGSVGKSTDCSFRELGSLPSTPVAVTQTYLQAHTDK